ncbi:hypothetical protein, partial [Sinorhizobium meliloti]|uniref:hypothetical protein n=1 Tax=Rhizobium meliloti TaxID=382 RepID=UPI001AEC8D54
IDLDLSIGRAKDRDTEKTDAAFLTRAWQTIGRNGSQPSGAFAGKLCAVRRRDARLRQEQVDSDKINRDRRR